MKIYSQTDLKSIFKIILHWLYTNPSPTPKLQLEHKTAQL